MKTFKAELQVRGYELDGYGHVNNAVYLNYAEFARWRMVEEAAGGADYFKRQGVAPILARVEVDYREPCFLADWLTIETTVIGLRTRVVRFKHVVRKRDSGKPAAELIATLLCVDSSGKAVSLPADFGKLFGDASGAPA